MAVDQLVIFFGFKHHLVDRGVEEMYCLHLQDDNLDCVDVDGVEKKGVQCFGYMGKFAM